MSSAIGTGIYTAIISPSCVQLKGVTTGVAGAGSIPTGKAFCAPLPAMHLSALACGIGGALEPQIVSAAITGFTSAFNTFAEYYGVSAGVGIGSDVSKIVFADSNQIAASIRTQMAARRLNGVVSTQMAQTIGMGISAILLSGGGATGVTGSPSPVPTAGVSSCFLR